MGAGIPWLALGSSGVFALPGAYGGEWVSGEPGTVPIGRN